MKRIQIFATRVFAGLILLGPSGAAGQVADAPDAEIAGIPVNYTEARVGDYVLPDPLRLADGEQVRSVAEWQEKRRPQIVRWFEEDEYGRSPGRPAEMSFDVFDRATPALNGAARRTQVRISFTADRNGPGMDLLIYVPANAKGPVPLLLNLSFTANSLTVEDPGVKEGTIWNREHQRVPAGNGRRFGRLPVETLLAHGFGVATVYYGDIEPDFAEGLPFGVRGAFLKPGQKKPAPDEWGAIAAWAWGLSRALDYLETDAAVDARRVALLGVSRLGKTVLWAGARDPRFALVIASCSGEGGAALSRRDYGETIAHLTAPTRYPYQFCGNYQRFAGRAEDLPVDAHMLLSLIAPRPVLLQTGNTDRWSDPKGEFLAAVAAGPVYRLFGKEDLGTKEMPSAGQPILHTLGYFMHEGGHGTRPADWDVFLRFLEQHLRPGK